MNIHPLRYRQAVITIFASILLPTSSACFQAFEDPNRGDDTLSESSGSDDEQLPDDDPANEDDSSDVPIEEEDDSSDVPIEEEDDSSDVPIEEEDDSSDVPIEEEDDSSDVPIEEDDEANNETPDVPVETDDPMTFPTLTGIELIGLNEDELVTPGGIVTVRVTGTDMGTDEVTIEVYGQPEATGHLMLLETNFVAFEPAADSDIAVLNWVVEGQVLDYPGITDLSFRAIFSDQVLNSPTVVVDVIPGIRAMRVFYQGSTTAHELSGGDTFPLDGPLTLLIDTNGLVGSELALQVHYISQADEVVEIIQETLTSSQYDFVHQVNPQTAEDLNTVAVYFEVSIGEFEADSPTVLAAITGVYSCEWTYSNGTPITPGVKIGIGVEIRMRVWAWGFEGSEVVFQLWEEDNSNDDYVADYFATMDGGMAEIVWTTFHIDDGLFNIDDEYYFRVIGLGDTVCYSYIIEVGP